MLYMAYNPQDRKFKVGKYRDNKYKMKKDGTMNGYENNWYKNKPITRKDKMNYELGDVIFVLGTRDTVKCYLYDHDYVKEGFGDLPYYQRPTIADVGMIEYYYDTIYDFGAKYYVWNGHVKIEGAGKDLVLGDVDGKCLRDGRPKVYNAGNYNAGGRFYHPYAVNTDDN